MDKISASSAPRSVVIGLILIFFLNLKDHNLNYTSFFHFVGNKAKEKISKWAFQENKARQIFRKTRWKYVCVSGGKNVSFSKNLASFVFLKHPVLRFTLLPYYPRFVSKSCNAASNIFISQ